MSKIINAEVGTKVVLTGIQVDDKIDRNIVLSQGSFSDTKIKFDFKDSEWNDESLIKKATFYVEKLETTYSVNVDSEGYAILPSEMFKYTGCVLIGVCGYKEENSSLLVRFSPVPVRVKIDLGSYDENMIDGLNKEPVFTTKDIKAKVTMIEENLEKLENKVKSVNELLNNANDKVNEFSENVSNGITLFNTNASDKLEEYNDNATSKVAAYDTNANSKVESFNTNATTKTIIFNENASSKTADFNSNADNKKEEYNTNADNKINEFNDSVDSIKKDINDNTSRSKRIEKVLYDSGEAEGTFINVKDSSLAEMQEVRIKGCTEQTTTEGYQMLQGTKDNRSSFIGAPTDAIRKKNDYLNLSSISLDNTENANYRDIFQYNSISLEPNTDYILSFFAKGTSISTFLHPNAIAKSVSSQGIEKTSTDGNMSFSLDSEWKRYYVKYTTKEDVSSFKNVLFRIPAGANASICGVMLEKSSEAHDWEDYTGLEASPNPSYPQKIKVIENNFNLISCNKNLLPYPYSFGDTFSSVGITLTANPDHSIRVQGTATQNFAIAIFRDENKKVIRDNITYSIKGGKSNNVRLYFNGAPEFDTGNGYTYTYNESSTNARLIGIFVPNGATVDDVIYPILVKGTKVDEYESHQKSLLPIQIPKDEFVADLDELIIKFNEEDKKPHLYLNKKIGRKILDGTEDWQGTFDNFNIFLNCKDGEARCTHLIKDSSAARDNSFYFENGKLILHNVYVNNILISTIEELKNYLVEEYTKDTPVTIYYELAEPCELDLGVVDMPLTFLNETNIFTDCDLQTEIKINYYRNPKLTIKELQKNLTLVDSKILTLESDINMLKEQVSQLMTSQVNNTIENTEESELIINDISNE